MRESEHSMAENQDIHIDPELWLQVLLAHMSNEQDKQKLINGLSCKTGIAPDKIEKMLHSLAEILVQMTRSN